MTSASQAWRIVTPLGRERHPPHLCAVGHRCAGKRRRAERASCGVYLRRAWRSLPPFRCGESKTGDGERKPAAVSPSETDGVRVIGAIGDQRGPADRSSSRPAAAGCISGLSGGERQVDGAAHVVDERMDFRLQPAAGASHAAILRTLFFALAPCWWTRAQEESIMTMSPS